MLLLKLNTSYKHHFIIAIVVSIWLVMFLVVIAPFDVADLPFSIRLIIMPFYGVISFACYVLLVPLQNWTFRQLGKWTLIMEMITIFIYCVFTWFGSYLYYKSSIINGDYPLQKFTLEVYSPIFLILLSIIVALRWLLFKKESNRQSDKIILEGENKLDVLQIAHANLVAVSSADNYVEVSYLDENILQKNYSEIL